MLEELKDRIRDRDFSLGIYLVIAGSFLWFIPKLAAIILVIYGLAQIIWKKEGKLEEHHHHHHHNNNNKKQSTNKKTGPMKKNYKRT